MKMNPDNDLVFCGGKFIPKSEVDKFVSNNREVPKGSFYYNNLRRTIPESVYDILLSLHKVHKLTHLIYLTGINCTILKSYLKKMEKNKLIKIKGKEIVLTEKGHEAEKAARKYFNIIGVFEK